MTPTCLIQGSGSHLAPAQLLLQASASAPRLRRSGSARISSTTTSPKSISLDTVAEQLAALSREGKVVPSAVLAHIGEANGLSHVVPPVFGASTLREAWEDDFFRTRRAFSPSTVNALSKASRADNKTNTVVQGCQASCDGTTTPCTLQLLEQRKQLAELVSRNRPQPRAVLRIQVCNAMMLIGLLTLALLLIVGAPSLPNF